MVLRVFGLKEEENYGEEITAAMKPDFHKRVTKSSIKLGDEPFIFSTGSRMDHKVRSGVMQPTAEIEAYVDLQRIGHMLRGFLDNYQYTEEVDSKDDTKKINVHEFWGGECSELASFSGWATFDYFEKYIRGLVLDSLKLEVSNEAMTSTESYVYKTECQHKISEDEYVVREVEGDIPLMFYDVGLELDGKPLPGITTSFSFEGNNNLNVDNTIGLGSRWPQKRAAAQKREIKLSIVSSLTPDTVDIIRKSEYGDDLNCPSDCEIYKVDLKLRIAVCEDASQYLELYFPQCHVVVEYETAESDEIETTFNLQTLGSKEVMLADGKTTVKTDCYAKLVNNMGKISPSGN